MRHADAPAFLRRPLARLIRAFAPTRVILFGSYAKGAARPESDVDLLVVAALDGDRTTHLRRARQLVASSFPPIDLVLCAPDEAAEAATAASPFLLSVLQSGIVLYSRDEVASQAEGQRFRSHPAMTGDGAMPTK